MLRSGDHAILVSVLAAIEVRSAIRRRQSQGDVSEPDAEIAIAHLRQETRRVLEQPMTEPLLGLAHGVIDRRGLRALDAIQLASALVAKDAIPGGSEFLFVTSDRRLLSAAKGEGFAVWNPSAPTAL